MELIIYYKYKLAEDEDTSAFIDSVTFNAITKLDDTCGTPVTENGKTTITCNSSGENYDNATYTLTFTIETVQFDKYKEAWNTSFDIKEDKGTSLASYVATNGTKYTGNGSDTFENDVYFLTDNTYNNVLFANKCWNIVRTTETGGVKLIYNGEVKDTYELDKLSDTDLVNLTNDTTYPYSYDANNKEWTGTTSAYFKTVTMTFSVPESGEYAIEVTSAPTEHKALFYVDDKLIEEISNEETGVINLGTLTLSNIVKVEYQTTYYGDAGNNKVMFSIGKKIGDKKVSCNNRGHVATTIGSSAFNINSNSPAYVGYMYNTVYESKKEIPNTGSKFSSDVEYNGSTYTLKEPTTDSLDSNNHYTCNSTEVECDTVRYYYFGYYDNDYYIELNGTKDIETAIDEMLSNDDVNKTDSTIKGVIDDWYEKKYDRLYKIFRRYSIL